MTKLPRASKSGFDLQGGFGQVLLLHGYTGTPYDLRLVADFLHARDFHVVAPLLKGHGTHPRELYNVVLKDWLWQCREALGKFDIERPIVVGGLSMGALLSIMLAASNPTIKAVLLFSPALSLGWLHDLVIASARFGILSQKTSIKKLSGGSDIMDKEARAKSPCYREMPVAGLLQFDRLRRMALLNLASIACPIFMAFGKHDAAIDAKASHRIAIASSKEPVFSKFYDHSKHVVTLDYDREELLVDMWQFLNQWLEIKLW